MTFRDPCNWVIGGGLRSKNYTNSWIQKLTWTTELICFRKMLFSETSYHYSRIIIASWSPKFGNRTQWIEARTANTEKSHETSTVTKGNFVWLIKSLILTERRRYYLFWSPLTLADAFSYLDAMSFILVIKSSNSEFLGHQKTSPGWTFVGLFQLEISRRWRFASLNCELVSRWESKRAKRCDA